MVIERIQANAQLLTPQNATISHNTTDGLEYPLLKEWLVTKRSPELLKDCTDIRYEERSDSKHPDGLPRMLVSAQCQNNQGERRPTETDLSDCLNDAVEKKNQLDDSSFHALDWNGCRGHGDGETLNQFDCMGALSASEGNAGNGTAPLVVVLSGALRNDDGKLSCYGFPGQVLHDYQPASTNETVSKDSE
ncbi:hypothetical protein BDV25DRAFT_135329 [Aspergillus avenaceus]|uniref:Uncharacterized protein n=1 Tax=Aspergillus avenaceus TaxID=36643 RepID=A0A5N6U8P0_ASPAV|nr:hypothetical protein BDV25DRAFT_135329 [Aspergillus avenaceus]